MSDFPSALKAKIQEKALNAADAAAAIGVSAPSLRTALAGTSFPNARSLSKYASFLGASVEETKAMIDGSKGGGKKGKAKAAKVKGKPGRKPGKKAAAAAPKVKGKPGRKPGKKATAAAPKVKGKPGRKPGAAKSGGSASAALASIATALKSAESLLGDSLAVAVNKLGVGQRRLIEGILKTIG